MAIASPAEIWRLAFRTKATYPRVYARTKHVVRKSMKVKDINRRFAEAAKACKGRPLAEFNACVADKLRKA